MNKKKYTRSEYLLRNKLIKHILTRKCFDIQDSKSKSSFGIVFWKNLKQSIQLKF